MQDEKKLSGELCRPGSRKKGIDWNILPLHADDRAVYLALLYEEGPMKSDIFKKFLAAILLAALVLGTVPVQSFAEEILEVPQEEDVLEASQEEDMPEFLQEEDVPEDWQNPDQVSDDLFFEEDQDSFVDPGFEETASDSNDMTDAFADEAEFIGDDISEDEEQILEIVEDDETEAEEEPGFILDEEEIEPEESLLFAADEPEAPGRYILWFQMLGNDDFAQYFDEQIRIYDPEGNQIGDRLIFEKAAEGNSYEERWGVKHIRAAFDAAPAMIEIRVSYQRIGLDDGPAEVVYTAPFEVNYDGTDAIGRRVDTREEILFCRYGIECEEAHGPLHYVDQYGNTHVQNKYSVFSGLLEGETGKETWFALRSNKTVQYLPVKGNINLVLCDNQYLRSEGGLYIYPNSSLTIWCQKSGTGQLFAYGDTPGSASPFEHYNGAPGIEVDKRGTLVINGGIITAEAGIAAAGIGSRQGQTSGAITINGGTVKAKGGKAADSLVPDAADQSNGAGIGGGGRGSSGPIVINGGTVVAEAGTRGYGAAGIGSGSYASSGSITITGGSVKAAGNNYGAGIGSGAKASSGPILISGGTVEAQARCGAGIGSGGRIKSSDTNNNGPITITGGTIFAQSGDTQRDSFGSGAGIGSGRGGPQAGDITISGGVVKAVCTRRSAGIGGAAGDKDGFAGGNITIDGRFTKVTALSVGGAGIGSGGRDVGPNGLAAKGAPGGNITINNGHVIAASTGAGAGIGGGNGGDGGRITINGGNVEACGGYSKYNWSSSGSGKPHLGNYSNVIADLMMDAFYDRMTDRIMGLIYNDTFSGAGIGGGSHAAGGTIVINGGIVEATAGSNATSAIGHGRENENSGSLTLYENSEVTYGNHYGDEIKEEDCERSARRHTYAQNNSYAKIAPGKITVSVNLP